MFKILIILTFTLIPIYNISSQESNQYTYIQLSSIYFLKSGSTNVNQAYQLLIYDQGRYLTTINRQERIILRSFCSEHEIIKYGTSIVSKRVSIVKSILVKDCGVDSNRISIELLGYVKSFNKDPVSYQRVDIELAHQQ
jgi:hypothetical protein